LSGNKTHRKTKELIIYLAGKLAVKDNYGGTLLNKALYFIDNVSYLKTGLPVSELTYIKQEFGPTPAPSLFLSIRDQLVLNGEAEIAEVEYFGRIQKKLVAKREADLKFFTAAEIALVDSILFSVQDWTGIQASDISHKFPAWQAAENKEPLPFFTFLLSAKDPSEEDIKWALSQIDGISDP